MHIGTLGMKMCLLRKRMARERNWRSRKGCEKLVVLGGMITAMQACSFKLSTNKGARQGSNERIPKFKIFLLVELRGNKQTQSQPLLDSNTGHQCTSQNQLSPKNSTT